jgi:hypothetical protein
MLIVSCVARSRSCLMAACFRATVDGRLKSTIDSVGDSTAVPKHTGLSPHFLSVDRKNI